MSRELTNQQELLRLTGKGVTAGEFLELAEVSGRIRKYRACPVEISEEPTRPFGFREGPVQPLVIRKFGYEVIG